MELLIIILIAFLIFPYALYGWLFGLALAKKLYDKEFKEGKNILEEYSKLSSEQRMDFDLKRKKEQPYKTEWLDNPSPQQENEKHKAAVKEPILETSPAGKWEDQKDQETSKPAIIA